MMTCEKSVIPFQRNLENESNLESLIQMVRTLRSLRHKHVVFIKQIILEETSLRMSLLSNANLPEKLTNHVTFSLTNFRREYYGESFMPEKMIAHITSHILSGLVYIHENHIIHRSVRADHIFITSISGSSDVSHVHACLGGFYNCYSLKRTGSGDFGWDTEDQDYEAEMGILSKCIDFPDSRPEDIPWYAPEILAQEYTGYHCNSDCYSLGLTCWEMFTGRMPYEGNEVALILLRKLFDKEKPTLTESAIGTNVSKHFQQFYELCTRYSMRTRPSANGLLSHSFLKSSSFPTLKALLQGKCD